MVKHNERVTYPSTYYLLLFTSIKEIMYDTKSKYRSFQFNYL
jgi:hypothetical protein